MIQKPIEIGKFGKTNGLKGHIHLFSFTDPVDNIFTYNPWFIKTDDTFSAIRAELIRPANNGFIIAIDQVDDIDVAKSFVDKLIYIDRTSLPELNTGFYWHDLVGKNVVNIDGIDLGSVIEINHNGAQDLLLIAKPNGKKFYIPFLDQFIIDVTDQTIKVDWDHAD